MRLFIAINNGSYANKSFFNHCYPNPNLSFYDCFKKCKSICALDSYEFKNLNKSYHFDIDLS